MKVSRLRLSLIAGAMVASLPIAVVLAQSPEQPSEPSQKGATFESLDTNSDGKISKVEAAANEDVNAQFSRYDQNGDGFIERDEVQRANQPPASEPPKQ